MSRIETTVVIDRPVEDVWHFLSDPVNLPTWCPEADDVTPLADGPFSGVTKLMVTGRIGPLRFRSTLQVIHLQPRTAIELRSVDGLMGGSLLARADLKPSEGRTSLTLTSGVAGPPGWLAALSPGRPKDRGAFFASLKRSLESHPRPATASAAPMAPVDRASSAEPDRLRREPAPVPEPPPVATPPIVAEQLAPIDRAGGYDEEERAEEIETADEQVEHAGEPTKEAQKEPSGTEEHETEPEQVSEAEQQVLKHAEEPTWEEDVPATVGDASAVDDPRVMTPGEDEEMDRAASREPAAVLPGATPADAADGERPRATHEAIADDDRLMLRLETERGPAATYEIPRSGVTIGRAPENTVRLDDLSVSRRHARISYRQGGYWLSDLKSASGTWVDEKKLSAPRRLASDQVIRIGILKLRVVVGAAGDEMTTNSEPVPASSSALAGSRRRRR
jgi:carbon monoxide dehydrogenase subunit G